MKHLFNKLSAFIVMLLTATNMFADKVVTIGTVNGADGGYGEAKFPMYSAYKCSETEFLYTADDLKDLPVGDIVKMSYAVYGGDGDDYNYLHISLWLENTDDTTLGGEMKSTDEMTRVLSEKNIDYTNIELIEVATLDNPAYLDLKFDQSFEYTGGGLRVHFRSWSYYFSRSDYLFPQDLTKIHERSDNNCILRYAYGYWGNPKIENPGRMFPVVKFTIGSATTEAIHHTPCQPTLSQPGYTVECWESDGKFYSDEACTQELKDMALAKAVVYAKLPVSSVSSVSEFDQSEHENDWDVDFNWAAKTTFQDARTNDYKTTRYAEFTPTGDNVSNVRLVWMRSHGDVVNGKYTVKIYVNGTEKFSVDQNDNKNVEGVFVQALPGLKQDDVVKFEVTPNSKATWYDDAPDPTFKASLEYNLSNTVLTANEDPDNESKYYTTFYDSHCAYTLPQGVKAYTATIENNDGEQVVKLNNIEGNILPKGEAVLLYSDVSGEMTLTPTTEAADNVDDNVFRGVDVETTQEDYGDYHYYMLSYGQNGLGFYKMNADKPLAAHKAFLPLPDDRQARSMRMVFADDNEVDGIQQIENGELENENSVIYNLNGMRMNKLQKGINIVNGKKVIVK